LAIGLKNEHALLFDTDRLTWIAWWHKGFISRTKSGRLWEWHPEGERLWTAPVRQSPIAFQRANDKPVPPTELRERFGDFSALVSDGEGVVLMYSLHAPESALVKVRERIQPTTNGWRRTITVSDLPAGFVPVVVEHPPSGSGSWTVGKQLVRLRTSALH